MKKFIASVIVCAFAVAMVACGGGKAKEEAAAKAKADSIRAADSVAAAVAAATAAADTTKVDSAAVK
jgi:hypothetical protein